jgi:hypothetical protein
MARAARRGRSPSDDSGAEADAASRRTNRKREVAALLADQRNHASVEELQALRSYVKNVFEHGGDDEASGGGRRRGRRVTNQLPDMFGVVRDGTSRPASSHRGGPARGEGSTVADGSSGEVQDALVPVPTEVMQVLNSHFHATRWRLVVPSMASAASRSSAAGPSIPQWARSTTVDASAPLMLNTSTLRAEVDIDNAEEKRKREANIARLTQAAFQHRRGAEDFAAQQEHHRQLCELHGILDHRSDAVTLRSPEEFDEVLHFLTEILQSLEGPEQVTGQLTIGIARSCGYAVVQPLLEAYADTRTAIIACDRWLLYLDDEFQRVSTSDNHATQLRSERKHKIQAVRFAIGGHSCCPKELLLLMVYGIVGYRIHTLVQQIKESPAVTAEQKGLFDRLFQVHPFSPYGLLPKDTGSGGAATHSVWHHQQHATNMSTAFSMLIKSFVSERRRVDQIVASLSAEAAVNIPLQRQTAKYESIRKSIEALSSRFDVVDDEERHLSDELAVQMEVSSRLSEFVQCGAIIDEKLASQPTSYIMENVLWTLPPSVASVQHREIEEALEKFLWGQPYALMSDDLITAEYVQAIRKQLLVNIALRRAVTRKMTILSTLRKLTDSDLRSAVEAESEDGVQLPAV